MTTILLFNPAFNDDFIFEGIQVFDVRMLLIMDRILFNELILIVWIPSDFIDVRDKRQQPFDDLRANAPGS